VTTAWLIGIGLKMSMRYQEILNMTPGEMIDCATCYAIANGAKERNTYTFDEIMEMR
jgi:hypothetical protein